VVWALTDLMLSHQVLSFPVPIIAGQPRLIPGQGAPQGMAYAPHLGGYVPIKDADVGGARAQGGDEVVEVCLRRHRHTVLSSSLETVS
jgi:hypothetical protein